jgi:WD40 repeat protein
VAVSPDGKKVAVAREHAAGAAMVLDAETGKTLAELPMKDLTPNQWGPDVTGLAFSPDGKVVAGIVTKYEQTKPNILTAVPVGLRLWEAATGNPLGTAGPADDTPYTFAFVPHTKLIACVGKGAVIHLWDTEPQKVTRTISLRKGDEPMSEMVVSADGKRAAVYVRGGTISVVDLVVGTQVGRLKVGEAGPSPVAIALSPDGKVLAMGKLYGDACVRVWDVDTAKERLADAGHRGPAKLSFSSDGKKLVSSGAGQVFQWVLASGEGKPVPDDIKDPDGYVPDPSWSKMAYRLGRYRVAVEYGSGKIDVHTRDGSKAVASVGCPAEYVRGTAASPDGRSFAISFQDRGHTVLLWTPDKHAEPFRLTGHPDACQQMTFTHDGKYLIAGAGTHNNYPTETLFVYETATGKLIRTLPSRSAPGHMVVTADDTTLITGGLWNDATVRAYDLATGKELATLVDPAVKVPSVGRPNGGEVSSVAGLALSADERFLAVLTAANGVSSVSLWDTGSWKLVKAFPPAKPRCDAASLAVARGGRSVFVAYTDSTILEWDVAGQTKSPGPTAARLDELWRTLGDPEKGYAAAWELLDHPAEAVAFLKTKLAPAVPPDTAAIRALVRQLGSDVFRVREAAEKKLVTLGESAVPAIREALAGDLSAEGKERAEKVIAALGGGLTAEQLRQRRAVAVLEWSEQADELLRKLAAGDPTARLTKDARAAAERRGR